MNARVKTVTVAPARDAVDGENGWIVVKVVKRRIWLGENRKGYSRWIVWDRANKDLQSQPEAAAAPNEVTEGIKPERNQTY
jgi:hypothetical protein